MAAGELQDDEGTTLIFNVVSASQARQSPFGLARVFWVGDCAQAGPRSERSLDLRRSATGAGEFHQKIEVARLAEALSDRKLREVLVGHKLDKLEPADPCLLPASEDFPDIVKLKEFAECRPTEADVDLMDTRATRCTSFPELEKLHRVGASRGEALAPAELLTRFQSGAVLLVKAPGAFGESFCLPRTTLAAIDEGMVPFFLDLRGAELKLDGLPDEDSCDELFKKASQKAVNWDLLRKARDKDLAIFVAVNGLNEARTPEEIERALAYLTKAFGDRLVLMATDRLSERSPRFAAQLCTILRLSLAVVASRLPKLNLNRLGLCCLSRSFSRFTKKSRRPPADHNFRPARNCCSFIPRFVTTARSARAKCWMPGGALSPDWRPSRLRVIAKVASA